MKIAVDAMGGDYAPEQIVFGAPDVAVLNSLIACSAEVGFNTLGLVVGWVEVHI